MGMQLRRIGLLEQEATLYDPTFANVEYLHLNDANTNEDSNNNYPQLFGSTTLGTPTLFGNNTRFFPATDGDSRVEPHDGSGGGAGIASNFYFDSGDIVWEAWVLANSGDATGDVSSVYHATADDRRWRIILGNNNIAQFIINTDRTSSGSEVVAATSAALPDGEFAHLALQRKGNDHVFFIDGVPGTVNATTARPDGAADSGAIFFLGCRGGNTTGTRIEHKKMRLGDTRVTVGEAFYPMAGFTSPTSPFPRP